MMTLSTTEATSLVLPNLCIVILFTMHILPTDGSNFTCPNVPGMVLEPLEPCVFDSNAEQNSYPSVICEMQNVIYDSSSIKFLFYMHIRYNFTIIEEYQNISMATDNTRRQTAEANSSDDEEVSFCVGVSSVNVTKVTGRQPWNNVTKGILPDLGVLFLNEVKNGFLHCAFNSSVAVGILDLDRKCWQTQRSTINCIKRVRLSKEVKNPTKKRPIHDGEFWESAKEMYMRILQAKVSLYMEMSATFPKFIIQIIEKIFDEGNLEELNLSGASLHQAPKLSHLPGLKKVALRNNYISELGSDFFHNMPNVEKLILAENVIKKLPNGLQNLTRLKYLDLSNNPFTEVGRPGGLIEQLTHLNNLEYLNLASVPLESTRDLVSLLDNATDIRLLNLNLSHTGIHVLDDEDLFRYQISLRNLDLSHNDLTNVSSGLFRYNKNLITLDLSYNYFTVGPMLDLDSNKTLQTLSLANNRLVYPGNITKSGYINLLDLSNNAISNWEDLHVFAHSKNVQEATLLPAVVFNTLPWVQRLNLSRNRIVTITEEMGKSTENLSMIDLGGNPLDCSNCHTPEFQNWLKVTKVNISNLGTADRLVCFSPSSEHNNLVVEVRGTFDDCEESYEGINLYVNVGVPVGIVLLLAVASGILMYRYRYEITYIVHLLTIKRRGNNKLLTMDEYKYDAFICFSGKDRPWVIGKLLPTLENGPEKFRLCMHERDFVLGSYISHNIVSSMHCSRHTIMVLTRNFVESQWCRYELDIANHKLFENNYNFLILLEYERLDRNKLPKHLRSLMGTRTYLEWPQDESEEPEAWRRLKDALGPSIGSAIEVA